MDAFEQARRIAFESGAKWQREQPIEITDEMTQRLREAFAAQLGSAYYPTIDQAEAILEAALNGGKA